MFFQVSQHTDISFGYGSAGIFKVPPVLGSVPGLNVVANNSFISKMLE